MTTAADREAVARVIKYCEANGIPAPAPLPATPLNYPRAPAEEWQTAGRIIRSHLIRSGYDLERAEEVAQAWQVEELTRNRRNACPINPRVAAVWAVKQARKYGPGRLTRAGESIARRTRRTGLDEPQPMADALPVVDARRASLDPATIAETGEALAARCPAFARRAREEGTTPAALALAAAGWLRDDEDEARRGLVTAEGAGYTPPERGCPGLHTATDPNPASRAAAAAAAAAELAALAAGLIQPRQAEQTAEPTAAEQAEQARQDWQAFKERGQRVG